MELAWRKSQTPGFKLQRNPMEPRPRNLEERSAEFAADVRQLVRGLPRTISNMEDAKQLIRASGSVAANCIEANEALGDKDRVMKFRICRKEAKECELWLRLVRVETQTPTRDGLRQEAHELKLIFSSIVKKLESR